MIDHKNMAIADKIDGLTTTYRGYFQSDKRQESEVRVAASSKEDIVCSSGQTLYPACFGMVFLIIISILKRYIFPNLIAFRAESGVWAC